MFADNLEQGQSLALEILRGEPKLFAEARKQLLAFAFDELQVIIRELFKALFELSLDGIPVVVEVEMFHALSSQPVGRLAVSKTSMRRFGGRKLGDQRFEAREVCGLREMSGETRFAALAQKAAMGIKRRDAEAQRAKTFGRLEMQKPIHPLGERF